MGVPVLVKELTGVEYTPFYHLSDAFVEVHSS